MYFYFWFVSYHLMYVCSLNIIKFKILNFYVIHFLEKIFYEKKYEGEVYNPVGLTSNIKIYYTIISGSIPLVQIDIWGKKWDVGRLSCSLSESVKQVKYSSLLAAGLLLCALHGYGHLCCTNRNRFSNKIFIRMKQQNKMKSLKNNIIVVHSSCQL